MLFLANVQKNAFRNIMIEDPKNALLWEISIPGRYSLKRGRILTCHAKEEQLIRPNEKLATSFPFRRINSASLAI